MRGVLVRGTHWDFLRASEGLRWGRGCAAHPTTRQDTFACRRAAPTRAFVLSCEPEGPRRQEQRECRSAPPVPASAGRAALLRRATRLRHHCDAQHICHRRLQQQEQRKHPVPRARRNPDRTAPCALPGAAGPALARAPMKMQRRPMLPSTRSALLRPSFPQKLLTVVSHRDRRNGSEVRQKHQRL